METWSEDATRNSNSATTDRMLHYRSWSDPKVSICILMDNVQFTQEQNSISELIDFLDQRRFTDQERDRRTELSTTRKRLVLT
jgi:hypothetical protein